MSGVGADPEATWHGEFERNLVDRLGGQLERWRLLRRSLRTPDEERELAVLQLSADFADRDRALELAERATTPFLGVNAECNRALNADRRRSVEDGELLRACQDFQVPVLLVDGADLRPRWAVDSWSAPSRRPAGSSWTAPTCPGSRPRPPSAPP